ncbi:MAG: right-handed parallel beta-helix repeat-containing protein [Kiritimatiellae bacterium]|nr:right-handed parallel beta-helix repeat-containing protein [Kiritimatiellia bacterium]
MNSRAAIRASWKVVALGVVTIAGHAETFYVAVEGVDEAARDGRSPAAAWRTLAYACERMPAGSHRIEVGPGEFVVLRPVRLRSDVAVVGAGRDATRLIASPDWPTAPKLTGLGPPEEFLIVLDGVTNVALRGLELASTPERLIAGAVWCARSLGVEIEHVRVRDFRWSGLAFELSRRVAVRDCELTNASRERHGYHGGLIRTRWVSDSEFANNRIVSTTGGAYGYKGSGHERVRIIRNRIEVEGEFSIESAHENEFGLEIAFNHLNRCVSVPKGGQGADPAGRGCEYSVRIHHNVLTDSYAVEGPRNHLRVDHNWIRCEKPGGRIYTHHGGVNHGPVWIHHNVIENADRGFIWMNEGLAERIEAVHNTVLFADAGPRAGFVVDAWSAERLNGWVVRNNVFIAPASQPRRFLPMARGVPTKILATHNLCVNITDVPEQNFEAAAAGFRSEGERPWPYFAPAGGDCPLVDRGVELGFPFRGTAPDLGALEWEGEPLRVGPEAMASGGGPR